MCNRAIELTNDKNTTKFQVLRVSRKLPYNV